MDGRWLVVSCVGPPPEDMYGCRPYAAFEMTPEAIARGGWWLLVHQMVQAQMTLLEMDEDIAPRDIRWSLDVPLEWWR